jgi:hypothetical protein
MTEPNDNAKLDNLKQSFQRLASFLIKVQLPYPFENIIFIIISCKMITFSIECPSLTLPVKMIILI